MKVIRRTFTSRCKDGSVVHEYLLDQPVPEGFVQHLMAAGTVIQKNLGGSNLYTFETSDRWISLKGMTGDTLLFVTCAKDASERAAAFLDDQIRLFELGP